MRTSVLSAADLRNRVTPIPTPGAVRALGSLGVGLSVAAPLSPLTTAAPAAAAAVVLLSVAVAVGVTLAHPYRARLRAYAEERNVARVPSPSMLVPLMLWWLLVMLAPALGPWPAWGALAALVVLAAVAWLLYPHVDGTRRLAYA